MDRPEVPFCPVILAGGRGTRFWPLSRRGRPKPFLRLQGSSSLLEQAWARARTLASPERIFVATEASLEEPVLKALPELRPGNLIVEQEARDTAAATMYAAWFVEQRHRGAVLALLPADQMVLEQARFVEAIQAARRLALQHDGLVCLGIAPAGPSTAYGYLECESRIPGHASAARVARFQEKPDRGRAVALLETGRCLWNAGIFVWRAQVFLEELDRVCPELASFRGRLDAADVTGFFRNAPRLAVDRAVLERSDQVWVVGAEMGWDDMGDWESMARLQEPDGDGNVGQGTELAVDSRRCLVHSPDKPVVLLGVEDLVVVECDDVLLVAKRESGQSLREIPALLKARGRRDLT